MKKTISFASDNYSGVHPTIMNAMTQANFGHEKAYGNDSYTKKAKEMFKKLFTDTIDVFFVFNGTGANVLALTSCLKSHQAIICSDSAHIHCDECGAPEKFTGSKLLLIKTNNGKITVNDIKQFLYLHNDQHKIQPKVISITQTTEWGTVYTPEEIKNIVNFAHENNMYVHMDGARIANAAVALGLPIKDFTQDLNIDILTFGGTKNRMMIGEAVIFFNHQLAQDFKYIQKQGMQLMSKMRFMSAQFIALLSDDLYIKNAYHANSMARLLAEKIRSFKDITITQEVTANAIFAQFHCDKTIIDSIQEQFYFYMWDENKLEARFMTSFDTTENDIELFIECLKKHNLR
jgi:threonine aldolase